MKNARIPDENPFVIPEVTDMLQEPAGLCGLPMGIGT